MDFNTSDYLNCRNSTYGVFNCSNITDTEPLPSWYRPLEKAHMILLTTILVYTMLAMGCTVEVPVVICHLKRPWPILVGALCQFLILPAMAFGLVNALQMETLYALGVVIVSCSPGGGTSNLFTYWVDGDVTLSIVMTVASTVLAFILMPLNIFIYTRLWVSELEGSAITGSPFTVIPFEKVFTSLASSLGPAILGVLIRRWSVKVADILANIGSVLGLVCIWVVITMQAFLYEWHKQKMWQMWVASFILPALGGSAGFFISKLFCQRSPVPRTVTFETGCQNIPLALNVVTLSFTSDVVKKVIMFPTLYGVFQLVVACIPISTYRLYRCLRPLEDKEDSTEPEIPGIDNKSFAKDVVENGATHENSVVQNNVIDSTTKI